MADAKGADPLALWREMLAQWEKSVNSLANQTMASDEFSSSMNGAMGLSLKMQETMRDAMAAYLGAMNLPSRTEVAALGERLAAIETRLDRVVALLERNAAAAGPPPPPATPRPPRTKRPPGAEPKA